MKAAAATTLALLLAACGTPDPENLTGEWDGRSSEWGRVVIDGTRGTYTDTYGPPPGTLELSRTAPRTFEGTWKETETHGGTLRFTVSEDGRTAQGTYVTWKSSPRRPGYEGKVYWTRVDNR